MTSLSHPGFTKKVGRLAQGWEAVAATKRRYPRDSGRRRFGTVADAVIKVLAAEGEALRVGEINARVERLLGEPVANSSVKNYLAKRSKGPGQLFERVGRGRYRLAMI